MLAERQNTQDAIHLLDELIPLAGASHAEVVDYAVEIPLRYAQCYATLKDGRKVAFCKPGQFMGWTGNEPGRSLLFRCGASTLELGLETSTEASCIRNIIFEILPRCASTVKKFVGVDGGLVYQPAA